MINGYKQLTGRYLKANKKRTILTIIGIVLSVALISTIGLFLKSLQETQLQDFKNTYGSWHLYYGKASEDLISKVTNNPKVARSGLFTQGETIRINEKLEIGKVTATDKALELLPFRVKKGSLPQNEKEAALEEWILRIINKDYKVGQKITIGDKEYILSGVLADNEGNQITGNGILLTKSNNVKKEGAALLIEISSKTNLKEAVKEFKRLGDKKNTTENAMVLGMLGGLAEDSSWQGLYMVAGVIIGIVLISTIAVIYNTFHISVVERIKQFGLLRAIGTTPKQIRKLVFREATVLAAISVPLGLLLSIIAIYGIKIVFKLIGSDSVFNMQVFVTPGVLAISAVVGIITIYISAFLPALYAGKISPLVAISSRNSISKEKIKRKKYSVIGKILSFEGTMAAKNIKRNKKRYRVTVFSMVISVMLFVAFKSFMDMTFNIYNNINESYNVHFTVLKDNANGSVDEKLIESLSSLKYVDKLYKVYDSYSFYVNIDRNREVKKVQDIDNVYYRTSFMGKDRTIINGTVSVYDNGYFEASKKYIKSGDIDIERLNKENGVIIIRKNKIKNKKTDKTYVGPIADIKVGDELQLQSSGGEDKRNSFGEGSVKNVKVMAILEDDPFKFNGEADRTKIITTEEVGKKLTGISQFKPSKLEIVLKDIKQEEMAKDEVEEIVKANSSLYLINNIDNNRGSKSGILMVQILIYGFVVVVSLIGSVNIINTLTTNIILRKREFGALKAIGLTQKGLKKMIVLEGLLYGIVGAIYGSIIGCGLSYLMYKGLGGVREFDWIIPWNAIAIASIAAIVIGYLSVLSPLSRIKKGNLIETIREEG